MKKNKSLTVLIPFLTLVLGFLGGLLLKYPPADESKLAGSIGKLNNYRNVKISGNDLLLRNELLSDKELAGQLQQYLSLHFLNLADLSEKLNSAVEVSRANTEFGNLCSKELEGLEHLGLYLGEARKDLLLALSALDNLQETDKQQLGLLIFNANNALAQVNFREQKVLDYVEVSGSYLKGKDLALTPDLASAHDLLLLSQLRSALLSQDKLKMKVLDGMGLLSDGDSLLTLLYPDEDHLKKLALSDLDGLKELVSDKEKLLSGLDAERLGIMSRPENLGLTGDKEKLEITMDKDKLEVTMDKERLGLLDSEKLKSFLDKSMLGITMDKE